MYRRCDRQGGWASSNSLVFSHRFPNFDEKFESRRGPSWDPLGQVAGGTDLVRKALSSLAPQSMSTFVLVDVLANDGWPALAALEDSCVLVTMYHFVLLVQFYCYALWRDILPNGGIF